MTRDDRAWRGGMPSGRQTMSMVPPETSQTYVASTDGQGGESNVREDDSDPETQEMEDTACQ